ncbi:MAG: LysR substrate-binding domain-containing protein [Micropruina glycogenica]
METVALVASGQRDLGIVHAWGGVALAMPDHLIATPLFTDVADVVLPRDHALADRAVLAPADLADCDWIATFDSTICRRWLRRLFDRGAERAAHRARVDGVREPHRVGAGGVGGRVGAAPRPARAAARVVAIPTVAPASTRAISAVHRRTQAASPALQTVLDAVREAVLVDFATAID